MEVRHPPPQRGACYCLCLGGVHHGVGGKHPPKGGCKKITALHTAGWLPEDHQAEDRDVLGYVFLMPADLDTELLYLQLPDANLHHSPDNNIHPFYIMIHIITNTNSSLNYDNIHCTTK